MVLTHVAGTLANLASVLEPIATGSRAFDPKELTIFDVVVRLANFDDQVTQTVEIRFLPAWIATAMSKYMYCYTMTTSDSRLPAVFKFVDTDLFEINAFEAYRAIV